MGFRAIGVAKPLPCAVRIKLLTTLFADTLRVLMTVIRRPAFCLGFGSMRSIALTLPFLLAHGFVNNDFINQFTRHLFRQLCGLLILLDEPDKPSNMSRGRFGLLQLLLNFRYLALKAVLFSRVFLHQGLVLLFGQQT